MILKSRLQWHKIKSINKEDRLSDNSYCVACFRFFIYDKLRINWKEHSLHFIRTVQVTFRFISFYLFFFFSNFSSLLSTNTDRHCFCKNRMYRWTVAWLCSPIGVISDILGWDRMLLSSSSKVPTRIEVCFYGRYRTSIWFVWRHALVAYLMCAATLSCIRTMRWFAWENISHTLWIWVWNLWRHAFTCRCSNSLTMLSCNSCSNSLTTLFCL